MSTRYQLQVVRVVKLFRNVLTKWVTCASRWNSPTASIVRVWPKEITNWAFMRYFLNSIESSDLIKCVYAWWKSTMKTEDLILNNCSQWNVIKEFCEDFPNVCVAVLPQTFVVETISVQKMRDDTYTCVICLLSWLPLKMVSLSLYLTLRATRRVTVSTE